MKKRSLKVLAAMAMMGTLMQFGGCNFQRTLGTIVDLTVFHLVEPYIPDISGFLPTGDGE